MSSIPGSPRLSPQVPSLQPRPATPPATPPVTHAPQENQEVQETHDNHTAPEGTPDTDHGGDDAHHGPQLLSRLNIGSRAPLQRDLTAAFSLGGDIGLQNHFDHGRGHNEFYLTPALQTQTDGNVSALLTANVHSKYVFDSNFLLTGGLHVGGEANLFSFNSHSDTEDSHGPDAAHGDDHGGGHDDHGSGIHFHGASEVQAGYQFNVGHHGGTLAFTGGGGVSTDFSHVNPYVTAGSYFEQGNHRLGVNVQYGQNIPPTTQLTWTIGIGGGKKDH